MVAAPRAEFNGLRTFILSWFHVVSYLVVLVVLEVLLVNRFYDSFYGEWLGGNFVVLFERNTMDLAAQVCGELTVIQLTDNHAFILTQNLCGILR